MRVRSLLGNSQRLDGGAMFGNAPKALWSRWVEADENNQIPLVCRCLLVEAGGRRVLLEAGIGAFFEPKMRTRYGVQEEEHRLLFSLATAGLSPEDIDVVVLSHLHFDHAGGLLTPYREGAELGLVFPKADYVIGAEAWARAQDPHPRDRASFVPELNALLAELEADNRVDLVPTGRAASDTLGDGFKFSFSHGHTPGMMLTTISTPEGPLTFGADLVPGVPWVHLPITMGYDRFPELLIDEKQALLDEIVEAEGRLFFTHDPEVAAARIIKNEKGRYEATESKKSIMWD